FSWRRQTRGPLEVAQKTTAFFPTGRRTTPTAIARGSRVTPLGRASRLGRWDDRGVRTVVCFGDSNTWGYDPARPGERFGRGIRWPSVLADALAGRWEVIAEGLNGRTATLDSPVAEGRNGLSYLLPCLHSHAPVDLVIVYLGTNDVGDSYALPA